MYVYFILDQLRREAADMMLRKNGDFLVRENVSSPGQFVLSTLQAVSLLAERGWESPVS